MEGVDDNMFSNNIVLTLEKKRLLEDLKEDSIRSSGLKFYSRYEKINKNRYVCLKRKTEFLNSQM